MKMNAVYSLALVVAAAAMFVVSAPLRAADGDDAIGSSFHNTFVYKTYLKDDAIDIKAKDGVATLTGTVAEESHKTLAQDTVENLPGVTRVDNQLTAEAKDGPPASDTWIGSKVKIVLMFHRHVSGLNTSVDVKDGIVTLTGKADNMAQKDLATEYAKDIEGVTEVKNEMTVADAPEVTERTAAEKIDDASITALVKTALSTHRSTSSIKSKVTTRDGTVTLTGIADNESAKSLVTKLVTDMHGVTKVENEMTVAEIKTR